MSHYNVFDTRATQNCYYDKNHHYICKKESIFHRIGRWILMAFLLFVGLILILALFCIIKRRRSKKAKALATTQNGNYGMPQYGAPYDAKPGQVNGTTAGEYYGGGPQPPQPVHH